eukprot:TRINITY_DN20585_c0_g1_i2.p1 TRINITY_DN20585_c0_g1~~TRINITY_DN20585_c0_g1_i2.p1  ORF type:complete len:172 (+),score=18.54 TRINITY_DN20585_c0_g1_i2:2-517(+)
MNNMQEQLDEVIPKIIRYVSPDKMNGFLLNKVAIYYRNIAATPEKHLIHKLHTNEAIKILVFLLNQKISSQAALHSLAAITNVTLDDIISQKLYENKVVQPLCSFVIQAIGNEVDEQFGAWSALCLLEMQESTKISSQIKNEVAEQLHMANDVIDVILENEVKKCNEKFFS